MARIIRIGSRESRMAMAQTHQVCNALKEKFPDFQYEIVGISTSGDKFMGDLAKIGGKVAFVKEIEEAMLSGDIDMAMHSVKDVPTVLPEGLILPCMLTRNDIRDVIVCREGDSFVGLKPGSKVGTSSVRRASQLRASFPHLDVVPLRGNVDTRLRKLDTNEVDCAVLAKCGLERVGLEKRISEVFEPDMMIPAVGQGAIGVECREDDTELLEMLKSINCEETFNCITAERAMLDILDGSCHTPIGGYCEMTKGGSMRLIAMVASIDGKTIVRTRVKMDATDPELVGKSAAEDLLSKGAGDLLLESAA